MKDFVSSEERVEHPVMINWKSKVAEEVFMLVICFSLCVAFVWQVIVDITN